MILYINGDSHSAGAEAVNSAAFANDTGKHWGTPHRHGHVDNLRGCFGAVLANEVVADWINGSESASSNDRIIRTTENFLETSSINDLVLLIGWSTWERTEWLHNNVYYQINSSGRDSVPADLVDSYKKWIVDTCSNFADNELKWHQIIWDWHCSLNKRNIRHLFFNTYSCFSHIRQNNLPHYDWEDAYINPYAEESTYYNWLKSQGFHTVSPESYHYGADAHTAWGKHLVHYLTSIL